MIILVRAVEFARHMVQSKLNIPYKGVLHNLLSMIKWNHCHIINLSFTHVQWRLFAKWCLSKYLKKSRHLLTKSTVSSQMSTSWQVLSLFSARSCSISCTHQRSPATPAPRWLFQPSSVVQYILLSHGQVFYSMFCPRMNVMKLNTEYRYWNKGKKSYVQMFWWFIVFQHTAINGESTAKRWSNNGAEWRILQPRDCKFHKY